MQARTHACTERQKTESLQQLTTSGSIKIAYWTTYNSPFARREITQLYTWMTKPYNLLHILTTPQCNTFLVKCCQVDATWWPPDVCLCPALQRYKICQTHDNCLVNQVQPHIPALTTGTVMTMVFGVTHVSNVSSFGDIVQRLMWDTSDRCRKEVVKEIKS